MAALIALAGLACWASFLLWLMSRPQPRVPVAVPVPVPVQPELVSCPADTIVDLRLDSGPSPVRPYVVPIPWTDPGSDVGEQVRRTVVHVHAVSETVLANRLYRAALARQRAAS